MADRIKVSAVSYVNSYPFIFGLRNHPVKEQIELYLDTPAACARKLMDGEVDLGLVPVAVLPSVENAHIVSDRCIGADGAVESVCLFSDVPLEKIERVLLDYQSRTSVQLVRILAERLWNIEPEWVNGSEEFITQIGGTTAGVVIGDRAFSLREKFDVVRDLSEDWKTLTGLPFVFACWVSRKELDQRFIGEFRSALELGLQNKEQSIKEMTTTDVDDMVRYVNEVISYDLSPKKKEAMKLFLDWSSMAT